MRACASPTYIEAFILGFVERCPGGFDTVKVGDIITRDLL